MIFMYVFPLCSICVAMSSATKATCPQLESNGKIELEKPEMEQFEWGMEGQKIKVRLSWKIPDEIRPCLLHVQVVRDKLTYNTRDVSAPIYRSPDDPNELEMEMSPRDGKDTAILATFNLEGGRVREIISPRTYVHAIDCADRDQVPKIEKFDLNQTSPGKLHLSWKLSDKDDCNKFYYQAVHMNYGDYANDLYGSEVIQVPQGQEELVLDVQKDTVLSFRGKIYTKDPGGSSDWLFNGPTKTFVSTDEGGCTEDYREPSFLGDKKALIAPLPRKSGEKQKVLIDWSHLQVSNPDCATYFVIKYHPANDKYGGGRVAVPGNTTSVELELKDGRPGRYIMKVMPSWKGQSWEYKWDEMAPKLTANL